MTETPFYEYNTILVSPGVYKLDHDSTTLVSVISGSELSSGNQFSVNGTIYTYEGGGDAYSIGGEEEGFYATTGSAAGGDLVTHFFSTTDYTSDDPYYVDSNEGYTVSSTPCFARGSSIATQNGEILVENLKTGDMVTILLNNETAVRSVKWVGHRRVNIRSHPLPETVTPIRIQRGAFDDNIPHRDLLVSPDHAIFADDKLICARQLVNGTTIRPENGLSSVDYFHVELTAHGIVLANGLPAESYLNTGNSGFFVNSGQPVELHPDMTKETGYPTRELASCAPFTWQDDAVKPVWQRLTDRAASLGQTTPPLDSATDPDIHIIVHGRTLRPVFGRNGLYQFTLPSDVAEVRIISRAAAACKARPWTEDRRRLGVYAERIILRGAHDHQEIALDHPALSQGWWAVEHHGNEIRRWTNGDAVLPLPQMDGPILLEIRAFSSGMLYPATESMPRAAA